MTTSSKTTVKRSGNPARRAAAPDARAAEPAVQRRLGTGTRLGLAMVVAGLHAYAATVIGVAYGMTAWLAILAVPAAVTLIRIPAARRSGLHRWPTIWALAQVVEFGWLMPVLAVAHTWALHRFWTVEFPPGRREPTSIRGAKR